LQKSIEQTIEENTATTNSGSYNIQSDDNSGFNDMDHKIIDEDDRQLHYDDN